MRLLQPRLSAAFSPFRCLKCGELRARGGAGVHCGRKFGCWVIRDRGRHPADRVVPGARYRTRTAAMVAVVGMARELARSRKPGA